MNENDQQNGKEINDCVNHTTSCWHDLQEDAGAVTRTIVFCSIAVAIIFQVIVPLLMGTYNQDSASNFANSILSMSIGELIPMVVTVISWVVVGVPLGLILYWITKNMKGYHE